MKRMTRGELARASIGGWSFALLWITLHAAETNRLWTWAAVVAIAFNLAMLLVRAGKTAWRGE